MKTFYVCSYGGCGSSILSISLKKYGNVVHVHSRFPPIDLEYTGHNAGGKSYKEWFNGVKIPPEKLDDYCVIYIYRNPIKSILSRFSNGHHLYHIQTDKSINMQKCIDAMDDLYGIKEFYKNYTEPRCRNYDIYCVKSEELFEKQNDLSAILGIGELGLVKNEKERFITPESLDKMNIIYNDLIESMNNNDFVFISQKKDY